VVESFHLAILPFCLLWFLPGIVWDAEKRVRAAHLQRNQSNCMPTLKLLRQLLLAKISAPRALFVLVIQVGWSHLALLRWQNWLDKKHSISPRTPSFRLLVLAKSSARSKTFAFNCSIFQWTTFQLPTTRFSFLFQPPVFPLRISSGVHWLHGAYTGSFRKASDQTAGVLLGILLGKMMNRISEEFNGAF